MLFFIFPNGTSTIPRLNLWGGRFGQSGKLSWGLPLPHARASCPPSRLIIRRSACVWQLVTAAAGMALLRFPLPVEHSKWKCLIYRIIYQIVSVILPTRYLVNF